MLHIKTITAAIAQVPAKASDATGQAFLQLWWFVMSFILGGAFGGKG